MAYESTTNVPIGQRISQGLQGAMKGAGQVIDWQQQLAQTQQKQQELQMHQQLIGAQLDQMKQAQYDFASGKLSDITAQIVGSDDPKSTLYMYSNDFNRYNQLTGRYAGMDADQIENTLVGMNKNLKPAFQTLSNAKAALVQTGLSDEARAKYMQAGADSYQKIINGLPADLRKDYVAEQQKWQSEMVEMSKAKLAANTKIQYGLNLGKEKEDANAAKTEQDQEKFFRDQMSFLTGEKRTSASMPYQMASVKGALADVTDSWLAAMQKPDYDPAKIKATKTAMTQLIGNITSIGRAGGGSGGNMSWEQIQHMIPAVAKMDIAEGVGYIMSKPQDPDVKAWLSQLQNEVNVERNAWNQTRNDWIGGIEANLEPTLQSPERLKRYQNVLKHIAPTYQSKYTTTGTGGQQTPQVGGPTTPRTVKTSSGFTLKLQQ